MNLYLHKIIMSNVHFGNWLNVIPIINYPIQWLERWNVKQFHAYWIFIRIPLQQFYLAVQEKRQIIFMWKIVILVVENSFEPFHDRNVFLSCLKLSAITEQRHHWQCFPGHRLTIVASRWINPRQTAITSSTIHHWRTFRKQCHWQSRLSYYVHFNNSSIVLIDCLI